MLIIEDKFSLYNLRATCIIVIVSLGCFLNLVTLKWVRSNRVVILCFAVVCVIMPTKITVVNFDLNILFNN